MSPLPETAIRPMQEADIDAVLAIEQASFPLPWKHEHFLQEIASPHGFPMVIEVAGCLCGYVCLTSLFEVAQILDIAVAPGQRGQGLARMLMERAIAVAAEKGAEVLELEVRSTNSPAIALYELLGFERTGVRARYYEGIDDAILMEKHLQGDQSCSSQQ